MSQAAKVNADGGASLCGAVFQRHLDGPAGAGPYHVDAASCRVNPDKAAGSRLCIFLDGRAGAGFYHPNQTQLLRAHASLLSCAPGYKE